MKFKKFRIVVWMCVA